MKCIIQTQISAELFVKPPTVLSEQEGNLFYSVSVLLGN